MDNFQILQEVSVLEFRRSEHNLHERQWMFLNCILSEDCKGVINTLMSITVRGTVVVF